MLTFKVPVNDLKKLGYKFNLFEDNSKVYFKELGPYFILLFVKKRKLKVLPFNEAVLPKLVEFFNLHKEKFYEPAYQGLLFDIKAQTFIFKTHENFFSFPDPVRTLFDQGLEQVDLLPVFFEAVVKELANLQEDEKT